MWTQGLGRWYAANGRHELPWRLTRDPWAVLVSEVMLQQTSVARVLSRWTAFVERWPDPAACAAAPLPVVLREWQGLGYPRRARALWLTAGEVARQGWPGSEVGLRALPGIGPYTARALLAFSDVGPPPSLPPRDVNLTRVAARAALGRDPHEVAASAVEAALAAARPVRMPMSEYTYALFDAGAIHCRAKPICPRCPLAGNCLYRAEKREPATRPPRQSRYSGSLRQLRGALLAAALADPALDDAALRKAVAHLPGATAERREAALGGLVSDGLLPAR